jgi:hypothetical protein
MASESSTSRHWQFAGAAFGEADRLQPQEELAEKVSGALGRVALSHIHDPFAGDRLLHQRVPPEGAGKLRMRRRELVDGLGRNLGQRNRAERADRVIHALEQEHAHVADVPGHEEGCDLPAPVVEHLVAAGEAVEDDVHVLWTVAFVDDVLAGAELADPIPRRPLQRRLFLGGERRRLCKFAKKIGGHR